MVVITYSVIRMGSNSLRLVEVAGIRQDGDLVTRRLYLTPDVDSSEGGHFGGFKERTCFASGKYNVLALALKQLVTFLITNERTTLFVRFKAELVAKKSKLYLGLVPVEL